MRINPEKRTLPIEPKMDRRLQSRSFSAEQLLGNKLASIYFTSAVGLSTIDKYHKILAELSPALLAEKQKIDGLSHEEIITEAAKIITSFLTEVSKGFGLNYSPSATIADASMVVHEFFSQRPNGIQDLGKICERLSTAEMFLQVGKVDRGIAEFRGAYPVLAAGHLLSSSRPKETSLPAVHPPISPAEIAPANAAATGVKMDRLDQDLFDKEVAPLWEVARQAKAKQYLMAIGAIIAGEMPGPIKLAIEKGIEQYREIKSRGEVSAYFNTIMDQIKLKDPSVTAENIFTVKEAYEQTAGRVHSILRSGNPPKEEELLSLTRAMTMTLILIAGKNS